MFKRHPNGGGLVANVADNVFILLLEIVLE